MIIIAKKITPPDIDVAEWLRSSPTETEPGSYPKLMYNVNLPPVIVRDEAAEAAMGEAWRTLNVSVPDVPPVSLSPESATAPITGGAASFLVTITGVGASGTWTVDKDAVDTWLTIVSPTTPQSDDGSVNYNVTANAGAERTGNIYVNGKTFTVTQSGL